MISEVVNALFLTYLCTEYLLATSGLEIRRSRWHEKLVVPRNVVVAIAVLACNVVERVTGVHAVASDLLQKFLHVPRIILIAVAYVVALYYDCQRLGSATHGPALTFTVFIKHLGAAFLYVLPVYPFLAVLISFGFMVVITLFGALGLDERILNWPIYYGTLYGPFSLVYYKTKQRWMLETTSLPTTAAGEGQILGRR